MLHIPPQRDISTCWISEASLEILVWRLRRASNDDGATPPSGVGGAGHFHFVGSAATSYRMITATINTIYNDSPEHGNIFSAVRKGITHYDYLHDNKITTGPHNDTYKVSLSRDHLDWSVVGWVGHSWSGCRCQGGQVRVWFRLALPCCLQC